MPACRKLSKHKSYIVDKVLLATPPYNPQQAAKDVQVGTSACPPGMVVSVVVGHSTAMSSTGGGCRAVSRCAWWIRIESGQRQPCIDTMC